MTKPSSTPPRIFFGSKRSWSSGTQRIIFRAASDRLDPPEWSFDPHGLIVRARDVAEKPRAAIGDEDICNAAGKRQRKRKKSQDPIGSFYSDGNERLLRHLTICGPSVSYCRQDDGIAP